MSKLTVVPFQAEDKMPDELIDALEQALAAAKEGTLKSMIISFHHDAGERIDDTPVYSGGHFFWRQDGRLDAVHSDCHVLAAAALRDLVGED